MLLFIWESDDIICKCGRFNTSHVTLYLPSYRECIPCQIRFNTSHITLYRRYQCGGCYNPCRFQYITCYSLSSGRNRKDKSSIWFQYITCYSLSAISKRLINGIGLFQYITCYSLSSPLTIPAILFSGFNTSHVTLYLAAGDFGEAKGVVSIHHMLLFIYSWTFEPLQRVQVSIHHMLLFIFQRIWYWKNTRCVSIHHMLLFITEARRKYRCTYRVSIHHMLLFIKEKIY